MNLPSCNSSLEILLVSPVAPQFLFHMDHSDFFLVRKKKDLWPLDVVATRHLKEICMECDALEIACGISSHLVLRLSDAQGIVNFLGIFFQGTGI